MTKQQIGIAPPDPNKINDPAHWEEKADEARAMAAQMGDQAAKEAMLRVAEEYEELAKSARARLKANPPL